MQTPAHEFRYFQRPGAVRRVLPWLLAGIAVVLFSTAGLARMMGWSDIPRFGQTAPPATSAARARPRCPECGVIVSVRENEITVRMADGSSRVIDDALPASWRTGERVIVIGGVKPPNR